MDSFLFEEKLYDKESLFAELKKARIPRKEFFEKNYPRKELLTGDIIEYSNFEDYFCYFFHSRQNMVRWLNGCDPKKAYGIVSQMFGARKKFKEMAYAPTEVELKSSILPSLKWFEFNKVSYAEFCRGIGLINRHDFPNELIFYGYSPSDSVIIDTREKNPLILGCKTKFEKIDEGDYSIEGNLFSKVFIERKSLIDFCGTLSSGFERFEREIGRAKKNEKYIVVLVESSLENALKFNEDPSCSYVLAKPYFIFSRLKHLMQSFDNIQFLFVDGRKKCAKILMKIFSLKEQVRKLDLQYCYDRGII